MDQVLPASTQYLVSQGVLGIVVIGLVWYLLQMRADMRELRNAYATELAAERKLNGDLQERRVEDYKQLVEVSSSIRVGLDGVLTAIRAIAS